MIDLFDVPPPARMRLVLKSFDDRREARGVCGKGVAMRRPPDLRIIEGRVSVQDEPKPSRGHPPEPDNPECLWQAFVAALERSKRTLALNDGLAAGHAYSAFLRAFVEPAMRGRA